MRAIIRSVLAAIVIMPITALAEGTEATPKRVLSTAVLDFDISVPELAGKGKDVTAILNAQLSGSPGLLLAERADVDKALGEQALGISGTVDPATAAQIGKLTGVKILITGRIFPVQNDTVLVAKILSTETGRVLGEMVTVPARESLVTSVSQLAEKLTATLEQKGDSLVAPAGTEKDIMVALAAFIKDKKLPTVSIRIAETHLQSASLDPAAETELGRGLQQLGFTILDAKTTTQLPDVEITGQAFSELGLRKGQLVSVRGRVEAKAVERLTGQVLWMDRQTEVAVDIGELIAGKAALEKAAVSLLDRMVRRIVK